MNIPNNANLIFKALCNCGYEAYFVGGCVRDYLMNRACNDFDITTSAKPLEIEDALNKSGIRFFETGLKHGTVTAVIDGEPFEITTYRTDGKYLDARHPESVEFVTDLSDDLSRRDFTVNALAYNEHDGIVDKFGGIDDIKNGIIRTVGNPDKRFNEDALRIMRALRFASTLGFKIESETADSIHKNAELLNNISSERIYSEFMKLLLGVNCEKILLEFKDVIGVIIPELIPCFNCEQNTKWHLYDVYTHIVKSVGCCENKDYLRLAVLLHDIGKPQCKTTDSKGVDHFFGHPQRSVEISEAVLKRLKTSREYTKKILKLIEIHDKKISPTGESIKFWLRALGEELFFDFMEVKLADMKSHNLQFAGESLVLFEEIKRLANKIISNNEPYRICDLAIGGNELVELGYRNAEIKNELEKLIVDVSKNPRLNTKEILKDIAKKDRS